MLKRFVLTALFLPVAAQGQVSQPSIVAHSYVAQTPPGTQAYVDEGEVLNRNYCLVRKNTGRRECHTISEWRKIAAHLQSAAPQAPKP